MAAKTECKSRLKRPKLERLQTAKNAQVFDAIKSKVESQAALA